MTATYFLRTGGGYSFVQTAFDDANTYFWPYPGDADIVGDGILLGRKEILQFAYDHAECTEDANGDC